MSTDRYTLVIGGGVIGVCCAYFLAKRGAEVTVLERAQIGRGASYGNAGCIAPGHPPINKPGRVGQAIKSLFHPLSPLYIVPRPDPTMASWLWGFSRTCNQGHLETCDVRAGPARPGNAKVVPRLDRAGKDRMLFSAEVAITKST